MQFVGALLMLPLPPGPLPMAYMPPLGTLPLPLLLGRLPSPLSSAGVAYSTSITPCLFSSGT